jgi:hypothetical protein
MGTKIDEDAQSLVNRMVESKLTGLSAVSLSSCNKPKNGEITRKRKRSNSPIDRRSNEGCSLSTSTAAVQRPDSSHSAPSPVTGSLRLGSQRSSNFWFAAPTEKGRSFPVEFQSTQNQFDTRHESKIKYPSTVVVTAVNVKTNGRETESERARKLATVRNRIIRDRDDSVWINNTRPIDPKLLTAFGVKLSADDSKDYRVDYAGNVIHRIADETSAMGWNPDHVFPWSLGGLTVNDNLYPLQADANKIIKSDRMLTSDLLCLMAVGISQVEFIHAHKKGTFHGTPLSSLCTSLSPETITDQDAQFYTKLKAITEDSLPKWLTFKDGQEPTGLSSSKSVQLARYMKWIDTLDSVHSLSTRGGIPSYSAWKIAARKSCRTQAGLREQINAIFQQFEKWVDLQARHPPQITSTDASSTTSSPSPVLTSRTTVVSDAQHTQNQQQLQTTEDARESEVVNASALLTAASCEQPNREQQNFQTTEKEREFEAESEVAKENTNTIQNTGQSDGEVEIPPAALPLNTMQAWPQGDDDATKEEPKKRKRIRTAFTSDELAELIRGLKRFGFGKWKQILNHFNFPGRNRFSLKDMARHLRIAKSDYPGGNETEFVHSPPTAL